MDKNRQHIIFDLDGTIVDSGNEILKTYQFVFNEIKPAINPDLDKLNLGAMINDILTDIYKEEVDKMKEAKLLFASVYDSSEYNETFLYAGVAETLDYLKKQGHVLYIATNKRYAPTLKILQRKGIKHFFSSIMGNEMQPNITMLKHQMIGELKRIGQFEEGFMIGDSIGDIKAGKKENLKTIAVTYGYEDKNALIAQNPTYIVDYIKDVIKFVTDSAE